LKKKENEEKSTNKNKKKEEEKEKEGSNDEEVETIHLNENNPMNNDEKPVKQKSVIQQKAHKSYKIFDYEDEGMKKGNDNNIDEDDFFVLD
jgi:hypothetical protein